MIPPLGRQTIVDERLKHMQRCCTRQFYVSTRERLIDILLNLAERYGHDRQGEIELKIQLSHEDLASFVGSSRESVSQEIGRLCEAGLVASSRRRIVLCNPERWSEFVEW